MIIIDRDVFVDAALAPHFHYLVFFNIGTALEINYVASYRLSGNLSTDVYLESIIKCKKKISTNSLEGINSITICFKCTIYTSRTFMCVKGPDHARREIPNLQKIAHREIRTLLARLYATRY